MKVPAVGSVWLSSIGTAYKVTGVETTPLDTFVTFFSVQNKSTFKYTMRNFEDAFNIEANRHHTQEAPTQPDWSAVERTLRVMVEAHAERRRLIAVSDAARVVFHEAVDAEKAFSTRQAEAEYNQALLDVETVLKETYKGETPDGL